MVKFNKITLTLAGITDIFLIAFCGAVFYCTSLSFFSWWSVPNSQFLRAQLEFQGLGIDYVKYMSQADMALHQPDKLYDLEAQRKWMQDHTSPDRYKTLKDLNPSYYPPPFCLASAPFLNFNFPQGFIIWSTAQVILLVLLVTALMRRSPVEWIYFWVIMLSVLGNRQAAIWGQTSFLMACLIAGLYYCWLKNKQLPAGVLLAMGALLKPHHCLVPFVMIIAKRQWKTLISFAVALSVIIVATGCVLGFPVVLSYPSALYQIEQASYAQLYYAPLDICINIRGIVGYFMSGEQARLVGNVVLLFGVGACYWLWRKSILRGPESYGLAMVITTCLGLICNLHANFYDLVLIIFPCSLALDSVGFFYSLSREKVRYRAWCLFFPVFWTVNMLHCATRGKDLANWHLLYLFVFAVISFWFWCKISKSEGAESSMPALEQPA